MGLPVTLRPGRESVFSSRASETELFVNATKSVSQTKKKRNASSNKGTVAVVAPLPGLDALLKNIDQYFRDRLTRALAGFGALIQSKGTTAKLTPDELDAINLLEDIVIPLIERDKDTTSSRVVAEHLREMVADRKRSGGVA